MRTTCSFSLLVTDLTHSVMLSEAEKLPPNRRERERSRPATSLALLSGPYTSAQMQGLRDFIYRRWESTLGDTQAIDTLPPLVRLAVSQVLRPTGSGDQRSARRARRTGFILERQAPNAKQAQDKFADAIRIAETLTGPDVKPEIRSEAMYNQAIAMHSEAPERPREQAKEVTTILTDLADQMPASPSPRTRSPLPLHAP
ncbi:MAG: hypothetical protein R3C45_18950 [Phycisphaerales bacterium]